MSETSRAGEPKQAREPSGEAATGEPPGAGVPEPGSTPEPGPSPEPGGGADPGGDPGSGPGPRSDSPRLASDAHSDPDGTSAQPVADAGEDPGALDRLLAEARRERDEYLELAQRSRADLENFRKRALRDTAAAERRGRTTLAKGLVPVLDNLERALQSAGVEPAEAPSAEAPADAHGAGEPAGAHEALAQGLALVHRELRATLERAGVESYDPAGERFDPEWHEALATRAADGTEPGVVVETLELGYRIDGQVLRAARVVVSE